jgi:hypothetical protein
MRVSALADTSVSSSDSVVPPRALPYSGITCMVAVPGTVCIMIGAVPGAAA